jgi:hypothetical protein
VLTRGAEMACCARRLSRRDFEVFRFGTAMRAAAECSNALTHLAGSRSRPPKPAFATD